MWNNLWEWKLIKDETCEIWKRRNLISFQIFTFRTINSKKTTKNGLKNKKFPESFYYWPDFNGENRPKTNQQKRLKEDFLSQFYGMGFPNFFSSSFGCFDRFGRTREEKKNWCNLEKESAGHAIPLFLIYFCFLFILLTFLVKSFSLSFSPLFWTLIFSFLSIPRFV